MADVVSENPTLDVPHFIREWRPIRMSPGDDLEHRQKTNGGIERVLAIRRGAEPVDQRILQLG